MLLKDKNPHDRDKRIRQDENFEENHIYLIDDKADHGRISVTNFVHRYFSTFDSDKIINKNYNNWQKNKDPRYYGMSKEEIKETWKVNSKKSSNYGSHIHKQIENYLNNIITDSPEHEFKEFLRFTKDYITWSVFRTEFMIFNDKLVGTIDLLMKDEKDGKYIIIDHKTSKEIKMNSLYEKGKFPLHTIPDCNYYHYSLQLSTYKLILETLYNIEIKDMYILQLRPDKKYKLIEVKDLTKKVLLMIKYL